MIELDWLKRWSMYSPNTIALVDGETQQQLTYRQFFQRACRCALVLKNQYQVKKGSRVILFAQNDVDSIVLFFALARLGATLVPVNYRLTSRELSIIVDDCNPALLIGQSEYQSVLLSALQSNPERSTQVDFVDLQKTLGPAIDSSPPAGKIEFESTPEDIALIIYTSGTTGAPKGAMLSHRMLFWNSVNTSLRLNLTQNDCAVTFLPLFHTGGWNVLTTPFFHHGAKIILLKKFDADGVLNFSERHQATLLFGVPTTMDLMARSQAFNNCSLKSIRYAIVGGEPMPLEQIELWHQKNIAIRQGYGLTEFGPNVFSLNQEDAVRKKGSIGFPNFYVNARIVNEQGQTLNANEVGELELQGPMCMSGYLNNPEATAETIQNNWLKTGDLVKKDDEGYYFVVGRKKEMFKSGGENVYPVELEQVIRQLPGIKEVAVIGVPDSKWGEVGKAFVSLEVGQCLSEDMLIQHCKLNLAGFKIPKYFVFLKELPKNDTGKIQKRALFELGV